MLPHLAAAVASNMTEPLQVQLGVPLPHITLLE